MEAHVRNSTKKTNKVPSWMGGRLTFSAQMSELLREELYKAATPTPPILRLSSAQAEEN